MKAYNCTTSTTDLVRPNNNPLINNTDQELFTDYQDFVFGSMLRYMGIKERYPNAKFVDTGNGVMVYVDGVMVYESHIVKVEPEAVEIPDEDECEN